MNRKSETLLVAPLRMTERSLASILSLISSKCSALRTRGLWGHLMFSITQDVTRSATATAVSSSISQYTAEISFLQTTRTLTFGHQLFSAVQPICTAPRLTHSLYTTGWVQKNLTIFRIILLPLSLLLRHGKVYSPTIQFCLRRRFERLQRIGCREIKP